MSTNRRNLLPSPAYADKDCMNVFLKKFSNYFLNYRMIFTLDGAGWHRSHWLKKPKNPELNPTEHIWDNIRENKQFNNSFNSIEHVSDQLWQALSELSVEKDIVKSMTCFDWINYSSC